MFGHDWEKADATIVARDGKFSGDGAVVSYTYAADVRLSSGEMFRATVHEPTIATDFWAPNIGDVVSVLVRSKDRKVKFDKDDPRLSAHVQRATRQQDFQTMQQQPAGTPVPITASTELPEEVARKLAQLGVVLDGPAQVFTADSAQAHEILAALTHATGSAAETPETRLLELQALRDKGLVTDEEYAEQRRRILGEI